MFKKSKWHAQLSYDGQPRGLGAFFTKGEVASAHDKEAREHRGSGVVCNFSSLEAGEAAAAVAIAEWERQNPSQPELPAAAAEAQAQGRILRCQC